MRPLLVKGKAIKVIAVEELMLLRDMSEHAGCLQLIAYGKHSDRS